MCGRGIDLGCQLTVGLISPTMCHLLLILSEVQWDLMACNLKIQNRKVLMLFRFLGIDPPESWLVEAVDSPYDLDNIYLEEVESGVYADFELEYLLLEGAFSFQCVTSFLKVTLMQLFPKAK